MHKVERRAGNLSAEEWMARALELAHRGEALAHPNPMVGAVLVQDGNVVGEGFHTYDGLRHAEIIALEQASGRARGATLYTNLEPCCHSGRTGPCADALLAAGVGRVVAAMTDPNPAVAGKGFQKLRRAGVKVDVGVAQAEARRLNEAFAKWILERKPFVTLKAAMTLDGQIVSHKTPKRRIRSSSGSSRRGEDDWITSEESRAEVQRMRHSADAVLTGIGTVLADDPLLTDRTGRLRRRPLWRVVLDSRLRLPSRSSLAQTADDDVVVFTTQSPESARACVLRKLGVEVVQVRARNGRPDLRAVITELGRREILSLLIEAGATVNWAAMEAGIVDKMFLFYAPKILGPALPVVSGGYSALAAAPMLRNITLHRFGPDFAVEGYLHDVYRNR